MSATGRRSGIAPRYGARQNVHLRLTAEQYAAVNDLADRSNKTQAQVIRDAVDAMMIRAGYARAEKA